MIYLKFSLIFFNILPEVIEGKEFMTYREVHHQRQSLRFETSETASLMSVVATCFDKYINVADGHKVYIKILCVY